MTANQLPGNSRRLLLASLCLTAAGCVHSHAGVQGILVDSITRRPLVGATVVIDGKHRRSTDSLGHYAAFGLRSGRHVVTANASGRYPAITHLVLQAADTIRRNFVLAREAASGIFPIRGEVWLGCAGAIRADSCDHGRRLATSLRGFATSGTWVFDNADELEQFWRAHLPPGARIELPSIDWAVERVIAATIGGRSGCGDAHMINRLEHRQDSTVIILGPDTLPNGSYPDQCAAYRDDADVVAGQRTAGPVSFVWIRPAHPKLPYGSPRPHSP